MIAPSALAAQIREAIIVRRELPRDLLDGFLAYASSV